MEIKHEFIRTATRNYISIEKPAGYEDDYQMAMIMENVFTTISVLCSLYRECMNTKD